MTITKFIFFGLASIVGVGFPSIATGIHHITKESIWESIKDDVVPKNSSSEEFWKELRKFLSSADDLRTLEIKTIQENKSDVDGEKLRKWCERSYDVSYKSLIQSEKDDLLRDIKKACKLPIKIKIEEEKRLKFTGNDTNLKWFQEKIKNFKNIEILEPALNEIKESSNPENEWKKLEKWCEETYERGYQGKDSNRWKLVQEYCVTLSR